MKHRYSEKDQETIKAARKVNKDKQVERRLKAIEFAAPWLAQSNAKKQASEERKKERKKESEEAIEASKNNTEIQRLKKFPTNKTVRLMFQDEAGFGRINKPKYCWFEKGVRPAVPSLNVLISD